METTIFGIGSVNEKITLTAAGKEEAVSQN
jgi:hypothetical protein